MAPFSSAVKSGLPRRRITTLIGLLAICMAARPAPAPHSGTHHPVQEESTGIIGVVRAWRTARMAAETAGVILKREVEEHTTVKAGQVILRLDDRLLREEAAMAAADVEEGKARLALAESEMARARRLEKSDVSSRSEFDRAQAELRRAKAALMRSEAKHRHTQIQIEKTIIRAPFAGVIADLPVEVSEYLRPGDPVCTLMAVERVKIESFLTDKSLKGLEPGMEVRLDAPRSRKAVLRSIAPGTENASRTFKVVFEAENPAGSLPLRPGSSVRWIHPSS